MIKDLNITLFDLAVCLSDAMDMVSPPLVNHHKQVAYIASQIGKESGLPESRQRNLMLAGALHDAGALSLKDRLDTLSFEVRDANTHCTVGADLLDMFQPFSQLSPIVRYHHTPWKKGKGQKCKGKSVPLEAHILHLADRIAVLIDRKKDILGQTESICKTIQKNAGSTFCPEAVDAFLNLSKKEYFWFDAASSGIYRILRQRMRSKTMSLSLNQLEELALFFAKIIDFRSSFTASHSCGVAVSAETIAKNAGFSSRECRHMRIAGYFHDLGKLAIPKEILEKKDKLTKEEFEIIRGHTYHTHRILDTLEGFETINQWGAFHHERISGGGYPFHHGGDDLPLGSRIMAIADVFTAVSEDRPYRPGMKEEKVKEILNSMVKFNSLDGNIVELLMKNYEAVNKIRARSQKSSALEYRKLFKKR